VSLIVANEFNMRYDLMFFSYRIYTTRFYRIISYKICFYESNVCVEIFC
jgi:hypothetical protein